MSGARILVVDDNAALAENVSEILGDEGYLVRRAHSIAEAEAEASRPFDVALVDVQLPDGDGIALAGRLKAHHPEREVVLLTGFASVESAAAALRTGACAYLVKPCATPDLLLTVRQAARQVHAHAERNELARRVSVNEKLAAIGTLTAGLSHEIRNPLNSACLELQILERSLLKMPSDAQPESLKSVAIVLGELRRLNHTLEDFLQFARPRELIAEPVDGAVVINRVVQLLRESVKQRGATLEVLSAQYPPIAGDENRLRQVLMNLALNAIDAAGVGGRVSISLEATERTILILVDDSGKGIPEDMRERIFEPFFTTKPAGSGLGLPIVHAIVTQHGGTITTTTGPMGGARFVVELPQYRAT